MGFSVLQRKIQSVAILVSAHASQSLTRRGGPHTSYVVDIFNEMDTLLGLLQSTKQSKNTHVHVLNEVQSANLYNHPVNIRIISAVTLVSECQTASHFRVHFPDMRHLHQIVTRTCHTLVPIVHCTALQHDPN